MLDSQVFLSVVSAIGGVAVAYVTVKYKNYKFKPKKDRVDTIFDGYEALIKQQQAEIARKSELIDRAEQQIQTLEDIVEQLRNELRTSQTKIDGLSAQLSEMKKDYSRLRATDIERSA